LKAKFESDKAIIDKTVFNAARIWKCYGTICKKGDSTEDRPHRTANLLEVPANIVITPIEAFKSTGSDNATAGNTASTENNLP